MLHIEQPGPGGISLHSGAGLAIPLHLLPERHSRLPVRGIQRLLEVAIHHGVAVVARVVELNAAGAALVVVIELHGIQTPPPHQHRIGVHLALHLLPAAGFEAHLQTYGFEHGPHRFRQIPAGAVATGVPEGKGGAQVALVANAIAPPLPACLIEQGVGMGGIPILKGGCRVVPRQAFHRAVCGDGVPFQQLIRQQLAVDGVVDGAAHRHIRGYVVADGITLGILAARRRNGEDDTAVLHAKAHPQLEGVGHCGCQRRGYTHQIELAAPGGGIGALFIDKDKDQPFEIIVATGVIGVRLHHQLLTGQEAHQPVGAGTNRLAGITLGIVITL
ncbi:hypothetical protein D3C84_441800 [compost metagenome]